MKKNPLKNPQKIHEKIHEKIHKKCFKKSMKKSMKKNLKKQSMEKIHEKSGRWKKYSLEAKFTQKRNRMKNTAKKKEKRPNINRKNLIKIKMNEWDKPGGTVESAGCCCCGTETPCATLVSGVNDEAGAALRVKLAGKPDKMTWRGPAGDDWVTGWRCWLWMTSSTFRAKLAEHSSVRMAVWVSLAMASSQRIWVARTAVSLVSSRDSRWVLCLTSSLKRSSRLFMFRSIRSRRWWMSLVDFSIICLSSWRSLL